MYCPTKLKTHFQSKIHATVIRYVSIIASSLECSVHPISNTHWATARLWCQSPLLRETCCTSSQVKLILLQAVTYALPPGSNWFSFKQWCMHFLPGQNDSPSSSDVCTFSRVKMILLQAVTYALPPKSKWFSFKQWRMLFLPGQTDSPSSSDVCTFSRVKLILFQAVTYALLPGSNWFSFKQWRMLSFLVFLHFTSQYLLPCMQLPLIVPTVVRAQDPPVFLSSFLDALTQTFVVSTVRWPLHFEFYPSKRYRVSIAEPVMYIFICGNSSAPYSTVDITSDSCRLTSRATLMCLFFHIHLSPHKTLLALSIFVGKLLSQLW